MQATNKIWLNGKFVDWDKANVHVLIHSLHYGSGVFEGIRTYQTPNGPAVFQLDKHMDRLFYSAESVKMQIPWSKKELTQIILETIKINEVQACYIRPIIYYGYGELRINPKGCPVEAAIAVWPWGAYLGEGMARVKISDYIRIHPQSAVSDAKVCGYYINSILANSQAVDADYTEGLLLDFEGNIAEGPGENFFIVKNGKIITPPLGNILAGITRGSVIELARDLGYQVIEANIKPEEAFGANECFFTGTAAEVTPIESINDQIISTEIGPITKRLKEEFSKIVNGENKAYYHWLTFVK